MAIEERWLRLWAVGVSPHGLGLSSDSFWRLSWREFDALVGRIPEDYVARGDRMHIDSMQREIRQASLQDRMATARIASGAVPDDLPHWARSN